MIGDVVHNHEAPSQETNALPTNNGEVDLLLHTDSSVARMPSHHSQSRKINDTPTWANHHHIAPNLTMSPNVLPDLE